MYSHTPSGSVIPLANVTSYTCHFFYISLHHWLSLIPFIWSKKIYSPMHHTRRRCYLSFILSSHLVVLPMNSLTTPNWLARINVVEPYRIAVSHKFKWPKLENILFVRLAFTHQLLFPSPSITLELEGYQLRDGKEIIIALAFKLLRSVHLYFL